MTQDNGQLEPIEEAEAPEPEESANPGSVAEETAVEEGGEVTGKKGQSWVAVLIGVAVIVVGLCTALVCVVAAILVYSNSGSANVSGTISYRERIALSQNAVVQVQIQDVSLADAPAEILGEQIIRNPGQVPIPFEVAYDASDIEENHTYALAARIEDPAGNLMFITAQMYPVITRGAPTENVQVVMEMVGGAAPPPTSEPAKSYIKIEQPTTGATVPINESFTVSGSGAGLPEGNVVVQALDRDGNVLDQQPATLQGQDVGTGGAGTWSVQLTVNIEAGTAGKIYAFSPSPKDNSVVAEANVEVSLGTSEAKPSFVEIQTPVDGADINTSEVLIVDGLGGGLPEGNVVVQVLDSQGTVLAEQAAILQGPDVGTGGTGTWSVEMNIGSLPVSSGHIVAFSPSPISDKPVAADKVKVSFTGGEQGGGDLEGVTWVRGQTLPDTEITALFENGSISGSAGCNSYNGTYTATSSGGTNTIQIGPLATTMMMCSEPVMKQEGEYMTALQSATSHHVEENVLTLFHPGGTILFEGQPAQ